MAFGAPITEPMKAQIMALVICDAVNNTHADE